jgi:hypothetical protein
MSDDWLNIRLLSWHLQSEYAKWWKLKISYNGWHKIKNYPDGYFSIYTFLKYRKCDGE